MRLKVCILLAALFAAVSAQASTSFPECPAVGNDTSGCELLITITSSSGGAATGFTVTASNPDLGPYDGADDTLVGILNNTSSVVTSIALSSSTDIFGFDGDGACTYISCPGATDPSGYGPVGVSYSNVNGSDTSGTVNFSPGLTATGGTGWFSLEEALTPSSFTNTAPEPASIALLGLGFAALGFCARRRYLVKR